jgi:hypothetical protein
MIRTFHPWERAALAILISGHLLAAWTSFGYHHPDEHYQILEWANHFVGLNPDAASLPWEYAARIRPWFQPLIHAFTMKGLILAGIYEPFSAATLARTAYGLLNVWALVRIWLFLKPRYALPPVAALAISCLWFLPYIHVRTSSENLAGIFLSFALLGLMEDKRPLRTGILFGFAFLARYQIALGLVGLGAALLIRNRRILRSHLLLVTGFLIPVAIGTVLDRMGYGLWSFSPYHYFKVNLLDGVAARYNPYPWWMYFRWIAELLPPISIPLFAGTLLFLKRAQPSDRVTLGAFIGSFFLLHCLLTNKEYRFLFPILNWVPFMAAVAFRESAALLTRGRWLLPYVVVNALGFAGSTLHGASLRTLGAPVLAHRNLDPRLKVLSNRDYRYQLPYYSLPAHEVRVMSDPTALSGALQKTHPAQVLLDLTLSDPELDRWTQILKDASCQRQDGLFPEGLYRLARRSGIAGNTPYVTWATCP